jgi:hypothetical protein
VPAHLCREESWAATRSWAGDAKVSYCNDKIMGDREAQLVSHRGAAGTVHAARRTFVVVQKHADAGWQCSTEVGGQTVCNGMRRAPQVVGGCGMQAMHAADVRQRRHDTRAGCETLQNHVRQNTPASASIKHAMGCHSELSTA